ncbi:hypothetical protein GW17_00006203 [Ensete ventricosum]|nr:hypothetical protein GW17_00006203 [Ensete ventricosum]
MDTYWLYQVQRHKEYRKTLMSAYQVENFEKWVNTVKFKIMRPNTMNKYGAVLDDFGLEAMLNKLIEEFVSPLAKGDQQTHLLCLTG